MPDKITKPELLRTTAVPCGTKFNVGSEIKDTTFQPGSVGYMSFALGPDESCPNVMFYNTVIVRRGQKGKLRVEQNMLLAPIFIVPGIPVEFTVPTNEERKYFVDMNPTILDTTNFMNIENDEQQGMITDKEHNFLAYMLSKGLFLNELDSASKPIEHPLMEKLNINGDMHRQRLFSNKKNSNFRKLINDVEIMVRENQVVNLLSNFWHPVQQESLIYELYNVEAALVLSILEYERKVNGVLKSAIEYIITRLKSDEGKNLKNNKIIIKSAEMTQQALHTSDKQISSQIESRLANIIKNRELIKSEVVAPLPSFTSGKKVTHVFASH